MASKKDHSSLTEAEENYIRTKSAYEKGQASVADLNAAIDQVLHPGYPSRAAGYSNINSGKSSLVSQLVDDAKQSPVVGDIVDGIDKTFGTDLKDSLKNKTSSKSSISSSSGTRYGSGSGSGSELSAKSSGDSMKDYLDMLHSEQERIWKREDTAYQRTVQDLQKAGLNPVLAAGSMNPVNMSSSSDSQVVGSVVDLASMAISGLTETAKGVATLASIDKSESKEGSKTLVNNFGSWFKKNSGTIRNVVNTAQTIARLFR